MRTIDRSQLPTWAQYVVILWANAAAAPFSTIDSAVECMRERGLAFCCEVIRVDGDELVWPWHVKGGNA